MFQTMTVALVWLLLLDCGAARLKPVTAVGCQQEAEACFAQRHVSSRCSHYQKKKEEATHSPVMSITKCHVDLTLFPIVVRKTLCHTGVESASDIIYKMLVFSLW